MSQRESNINRTLALYQALKQRDTAQIDALLVEEPVWDVAPGTPNGKVMVGKQAIFGEFYPSILALYHTFTAKIEHVVGDDDNVVVTGNYLFQREESSETEAARFCHHWTFDDKGKIEGVWQVADSKCL
ncbi:nuclear transport factor 2 family protein [Thaumasiovibrio subtropicus]|uniref:nuclear transport factor 2 family protein n=1 Tax=Thaumasiovibrio subtropicus TaxID=1891207 RepID=UPI000B353D9E|nr:nuclear transport factor 2 family protein [Thaumasiovibrio subtropicus]